MQRGDCPLCTARVLPGATHCGRCGARLAPLPRPAHRPPPASPPLEGAARWWRAAWAGTAAGAVLTLGCAAGAAGWAWLRGDYWRALGNAAGVAGCLALLLSVLAGGIQVSRWWGADVELLRARALGGGGWASGPVRLGLAVAGLVPLGVAVVLAAVGR